MYKIYMDRGGSGKCVGTASNLDEIRKKACKLLPNVSNTKRVYVFRNGKHIGTLMHSINYNYFPEYETVVTWEAYDINPNTGRTM